MFRRIQLFFSRKAFRRETNFKLNHFTLHSTDPEIRRDVAAHRKAQARHVCKPWVLLNFVVFIGLLCIYCRDRNPAYLVKSVGGILASLSLIVLNALKKHEYTKYVLYAQYLLQGTLLVCMRNLPTPFRQESCILGSGEITGFWFMIMMLPIHRFHVAFLVMTPCLLTFTYLESMCQVEQLSKLKQFLPEHLHNEVDINMRDVMTSRSLMLLVASAVFCFCHYHYELQTMTLLIEKNLIARQQKQLQHFMSGQKQAIVLYKLSGSLENQTLEVPLQNPAVEEILSLSFANS